MKTNIISIDAGIRRRQAVLESKLKDLLTHPRDREELAIQPMADPLDQIRSSTDRDMAVETLNQQARSLQDVQAALTRMQDGRYGRCERCEEEIPGKRLDALPWARLCVDCQSAVESESGQGRTILHSAA